MMLNVGIIQMQSTPLKVEENLLLAESLIVQAAKDGAQLVVLPEMFNVGYYLGEELMSVTESMEGGKTCVWLKSQAARLGVYIVTSLYERHEEHFYNTMVMVGSDGGLQYYRKRNPALSEVAVWRRSPTPGPGIFERNSSRLGLWVKHPVCDFSGERYVIIELAQPTHCRFQKPEMIRTPMRNLGATSKVCSHDSTGDHYN